MSDSNTEAKAGIFHDIGQVIVNTEHKVVDFLKPSVGAIENQLANIFKMLIGDINWKTVEDATFGLITAAISGPEKHDLVVSLIKGFLPVGWSSLANLIAEAAYNVVKGSLTAATKLAIPTTPIAITEAAVPTV